MRTACLLLTLGYLASAVRAAGRETARHGWGVQPGFKAADVREQARAVRPLNGPSAGLNSLPDAGEFLMDTSISPVTAQGNQLMPAVAFDGANFLVAWQDERGGRIFGARLTPQGAILDPMGVTITPEPGDRGSPDVCFDGANFLVVWEENRTGTDWDIYGARVTPQGAVLDPSGIAISAADADQMTPAVAFDGANLFVVWADNRSDTTDTTDNIFGARVTPQGAVLDAAGIPISTADDDQSTPAIAFDGANFLVVWEDYRDTSCNIYGARVTRDGTVLDATGFSVTTAANDQLAPATAFDGTNFLAVWQDARGSNYDIYAARVTPQGVVLDGDGLAISLAAGNQGFPALAFDGANILVTWGDHRGGSGYDIYGARVTTQGAVLDPAGIGVSQAAREQYYPAVGFDGANLLVAWQDDRSGANYDIYVARLSPAGVVLDPTGLLTSQAAHGQATPAAGFDGANYLVAWQDFRAGPAGDIYGSRVTSQGVVLDPAGFVISQTPREQFTPAVGFDGANFLVVWQDCRGDPGGDIYGARVTSHGVVLDPAGFAIAQAPEEQSAPVVEFDGTNFLVVWQDYRDSVRFHVYGARVTPQGLVLDPSGMSISSGPGFHYAPAVAFDTTNFLVVWQDSRNGSDWDTYGARVSRQGTVLDPDGIAVSQAENNQHLPALSFDGAEFLVVWQDNRYGYDHDVFGARVTPQGTLLDPTGRPVSTSPGEQLMPSISFDGADFLVVWQDYRNLNDFEVYGAMVSPGGVVFRGGPVVRQSGDQMYPRLRGGGGGQALLVYQGWAGTVDGKDYNTNRTWGKTDPNPAVEEVSGPEVRRANQGPTILFGAQGVKCLASSIVFDAMGRRVMNPRTGILFVRDEGQGTGGEGRMRKVVLLH
jgi:phosphoribosylformylglycinamidine (FGAM) synthase PurS component